MATFRGRAGRSAQPSFRSHHGERMARGRLGIFISGGFRLDAAGDPPVSAVPAPRHHLPPRQPHPYRARARQAPQDTTWMPRSCSSNDMNAASTPYDPRASRPRSRKHRSRVDDQRQRSFVTSYPNGSAFTITTTSEAVCPGRMPSVVGVRGRLVCFQVVDDGGGDSGELVELVESEAAGEQAPYLLGVAGEGLLERGEALGRDHRVHAA